MYKKQTENHVLGKKIEELKDIKEKITNINK
jgi:hypothetical protein